MISRALASPARRAQLALGGGVLLALCLALAPGPWASGSLRAAAAVCAIAGVALLARTGRRATAPGPRLTVLARQPLSRDVGVALLELDGRPVLVGFGAGGVQLLEPTLDRPDRTDPGALPALPDPLP